MRALEGGTREGAPQVLITSADPFKLEELVRRERARHSIVVIREQSMVRPGVWGVAVYQLKPLRRPWVRPAAIATGVAVAGLVAWWVVSALLTLLPLILGAVVALTVAGVLVARAGGSSVDVHVKVRH